MAEVGYDPKRSRVSDDKLAEFIRSAITGKVTEIVLGGTMSAAGDVWSKSNGDAMIRSSRSSIGHKVPGIGERGEEILAQGDGDDCVTNTYQLIGKFLSLRGPDKDDHQVDSVEHCDKFWYWLQAKGINSNRSGIVNAIAEKVNTWIPGIYDADSYNA